MAIQVGDTGGAVAATGNTTSTAAYASRPAFGTDGNLFFPSDGVSVQRDTGSAWVPWGPLFPLATPPTAGWSWDNQGGASVAAAGGGIYLLAPAAANFECRVRYRTAPSVPYVITAWILPLCYNVDYAAYGLAFRQSSDGKMAILRLASISGAWNISSDKLTDSSTYSAAYASTVTDLQFPICLRIADNNTSRICSWSTDGQNFHTFHTVGRTDFLTADEVGFWAKSHNATYPAAVTLLSWEES